MSTTGTMAGTATSKNNAVTGSPSNGYVQQYDLLGNTMATIVTHPTSGCTNMAIMQAGGTTSMTWTREANNGDANDAQISLTGPTIVIWAFGTGPTYTDSPLPPMSWASVDLAGLATASPSPSAGASASPAPTYPFSTSLATPFKLYWNRNGDTFNFKAVLNQLGW